MKIPGEDSLLQAKERPGTDPSLLTSEGTNPTNPFGPGPMAARTVRKEIPVSLSLWLLTVAAPANFIQPLKISCHTSHKIQTPYHGAQVIWAQPANGRFRPRLLPPRLSRPGRSTVLTPAQAWPPRCLPRGVLSMTSASTANHCPDLIFLPGTYWPPLRLCISFSTPIFPLASVLRG